MPQRKKQSTETVTEEAQTLNLTKTLISYFKYVQELKKTVSKDLKGSMRKMPHQLLSIKIDYLKKIEILELKSITEMGEKKIIRAAQQQIWAGRRNNHQT